MLKGLITIILFLGFTFKSSAQEQKYQLSTHILNVSLGLPAPDVAITLEKMMEDKSWKVLSKNTTDLNGRIQNFLPYGTNNNGIYKLTFFTDTYFKSLNQKSFYPFIEVIFQIDDDKHYHVPITLSPYGYATYRGN